MSVSFAVLRVKPLRDARSLSGASRHNLRLFFARNVDQSRTRLNRPVRGSGDFVADFRGSRFSRVNTFRAGDNIAGELVLTARAAWFDERFPCWRKNPLVLKPWIDSTNQFLIDKFGENYISGIIHLDEESPHFHCLVVPTKAYKRKLNGREYEFERISYSSQFSDSKAVFRRAREEQNPELTKLGRLQTEYAKSVEHLGLVRGRNSYTQKPRRHITTREYQAENALLNEKFASELSLV